MINTILEYLKDVSVIILFISAALGCIGSFLSNKTHKFYIKALLWIQTFTLRHGYSPFCAPWNYIKKIAHKIHNSLTNKQEAQSPKRQAKGLVGTIAVDIKKLLTTTIENTGFNKIYFAEEGGDYYKRNTELSDKQIDKECDKIIKYYDEIEGQINNLYCDNPLFQYEESTNNELVKVSICEKFKKIYSKEEIKRYIKVVNDEMSTNNAIHFIGDKIGVKDFNITKEGLQLYSYKTDHFTWQVFKEIFKANKSFFQEIILRVNANGITIEEQRIIINCLAFLFSSFGVDIIIESVNCQKERNLIITARSGKIEKNRYSSLHVSVNETFSRTDNVDSSTTIYDITSCVKRGIEEEIGIRQEEIPDSCIKFHDFAIVTDEGEIGLSCHVNLTNVMPIEKILMHPGVDKFLENEEVLVLPYFHINHLELIKSVSSEKFMRQFYLKTYNDRFSMPWMSFTPLLISRVLIRNIKYSYICQFLWFIVYWTIIGSSLSLIRCNFSILNEILATGCSLAVYSLIIYFKKHTRKQKYKFIQPFVSQWYGNAKVVQATGRTENENICDGIEIYTNTRHFKSLSDFVLSAPPYCSVRIKQEGTFSEMPISLYRIQNRRIGICYGKLNFFSLNVSTISDETKIKIRFYYEKDEMSNLKKVKRISFTEKIEMDSTKFKVKDVYTLTLSDDFVKKYTIYDLFQFNGDYYWTCTNKEYTELIKNDIPIFELNKRSYNNKTRIKDIFKKVSHIISMQEGNDGYIDIIVCGKNNIMERWLNKFANQIDNKRKIDELEKYMLQLYFIRKDIIFADCEYSNTTRYNIFYSQEIK